MIFAQQKTLAGGGSRVVNVPYFMVELNIVVCVFHYGSARCDTKSRYLG